MRRTSSAKILEDYFRPEEQQKQDELTQHVGERETKTNETGGQEMKRREKTRVKSVRSTRTS